MPEDIIRVLRVIEYVGTRKLVEDTVSRSVHGPREFSSRKDEFCRITGATIGTYPEILGQPQEGV